MLNEQEFIKSMAILQTFTKPYTQEQIKGAISVLKNEDTKQVCEAINMVLKNETDYPTSNIIQLIYKYMPKKPTQEQLINNERTKFVNKIMKFLSIDCLTGDWIKDEFKTYDDYEKKIILSLGGLGGLVIKYRDYPKDRDWIKKNLEKAFDDNYKLEQSETIKLDNRVDGAIKEITNKLKGDMK